DRRAPGDAGVPPAPLPPAPAASPPPEGRRPPDPEVFDKLADEILLDAWDAAEKIDRLIWRYRGMVRIILSASDSRQYARALELGRRIENAESRAEALILLAEAQCNAAARRLRRAEEDRRDAAAPGAGDQEAPAAYQETVKAVAE